MKPLEKQEALEILRDYALACVGLAHAFAQNKGTEEAIHEAGKIKSEVFAAVKVLQPFIEGGQIESSIEATLNQRIAYILKDTSKRTGEIIQAIPDANPVSVKRQLKNMVSSGQIRKLKHGIYAECGREHNNES